MIMNPLYTPQDIAEAIDAWKANCGPAALAAVLGCPMAVVRDYFPRYPSKPWTNPTHMKAAIVASGYLPRLTIPSRIKQGRRLPTHGVAFVQFWSDAIEAMPVLRQYQHTHWIATHGESGAEKPAMIYDINADGWIPPDDWKEELWPRFQEATGATSIWIRTAYEVF